MTKINLSYNHDSYSDKELNESLSDLLEEQALGAMSSVHNGQPHINTAYFVPSNDLTLYFLSPPDDRHSLFVKENPSVAIALWKHPEEWGINLHGVQLFGTCEKLGIGTELVSAMSLYLKRFPAVQCIIKEPGKIMDGVNSRLYAVRVSSIKLLDEARFGEEKYIELEPVRK